MNQTKSEVFFGIFIFHGHFYTYSPLHTTGKRNFPAL